MKTIILGILVIGINLFAIVPLIPRVNEEDIGENIKHLKKHQWFQDLLRNGMYRELIIHDQQVRKTIGKFNSNKLEKKSFTNRYEKKLQSILHQKTGQLT
ncbi:hypothetical protein J14TS2_34000 [Bacillus sp. J14TS2]|uniref:hypothetical protein n=1 Tax=Bacillus sp. J14TS2 TaxID=2807188 RepID=UPI001B283B78|nr:hypothetical protein [Bacillus sp. J14TS2]GIN72925.1 hypothetical protein J14TS2_34000 [Bacillus sp. J14TS2]